MDLTKIFYDAPDYVVLRKSATFPIINPNQDVDILVRSISEWVMYLKDVLRKYPGNNHNYPLTNEHHQLDYYEKGELRKFDLYRIYINSAYTSAVWQSKDIWNGFIVPSNEMNNISKCYEYIKHGKSKYADYEIYLNKLNAFTY